VCLLCRFERSFAGLPNETSFKRFYWKKRSQLYHEGNKKVRYCYGLWSNFLLRCLPKNSWTIKKLVITSSSIDVNGPILFWWWCCCSILTFKTNYCLHCWCLITTFVTNIRFRKINWPALGNVALACTYKNRPGIHTRPNNKHAWTSWGPFWSHSL